MRLRYDLLALPGTWIMTLSSDLRDAHSERKLAMSNSLSRAKFYSSEAEVIRNALWSLAELWVELPQLISHLLPHHHRGFHAVPVEVFRADPQAWK